MLWSKKTANRTVSFVCLVALSASGIFLSSCQVRPLYGNPETDRSLKSVLVDAPADRTAQIVRNQLVFLLSGGAGDPSNPAYQLKMNVTEDDTGVLLESSSDTAQAGRITLAADYTLIQSDGQSLLSGKRRATALVDYSDQEFSKLRVILNARERAGRELAEMIRADIAATLARKQP